MHSNSVTWTALSALSLSLSETTKKKEKKKEMPDAEKEMSSIVTGDDNCVIRNEATEISQINAFKLFPFVLIFLSLILFPVPCFSLFSFDYI